MKHADWNVKDWMDLMHIALKKEGKKPLRDMRKLVWDNTLKILSKGQYQTPDKEVTLDLSPNIAEQTIYYDHEVKIPADAPRTERTLIKVEQEDTLNATRKMIDNGQNPCLLNMGNRHIPGGDIFDGWGAQEENLIRRSDYFRSIFTLLDDPIENLNALCEKLGITPFDLKRDPEHSYPMDVDFGGVYTPGVTVFRGDEAMYERSIKTINNFSIYPEAQYWIERELKIKLGWDNNRPAVQEFYSLVKRRFS